MNRCEHGQKITLFCASDCCVWKEAGGCENCMKKYHNHVGTTVFLTEEEVIGIVKKYTMDTTIKPKCRVLQETIYAHFNLLKNELSSSLDAACKNIINQIGYPYLYAHNALSTYKRLKNKEYKKVIQKDFKVLHELTLKVNEKDLSKEESKIYVTQMKNTEDLIYSLEDILKRYEQAIKKYHLNFTHDTQHMVKINDILKHLTESPRNSQLRTHEPQNKDKQSSPASQLKDKERKEINVKGEATPNPDRISALGVPPSLNRQHKNREVSLDKKIVKQHKFSANQSPVSKAEKGRENEETSLLSKQLDREKNERMDSVRQELNNKEMQINEKKRKLIEMMKQKEDKPKDKEKLDTKHQTDKSSEFKDSPFNSPLSDLKDSPFSTISKEKKEPVPESHSAKDANRPKPLTVKPIIPTQLLTKEQEIIFHDSEPVKSMSNSENNSKSEVEDQMANHAFTSLPVQEKSPKFVGDRQQLKQKVIVIPQISQPEHQEIYSPLFKIRNIMDRLNNSSLMQSGCRQKPQRQGLGKKGSEREPEKESNILQLIPIYHKKTETQMELKENEEKSLALLLKSLNMKAEEAITYLEKAIFCADNNLSAAQYLSFLYLELGRPTDCLKLCNRILQKIENSSEPEQLSLILNNNKTAALNILGRYSQSIVLLQRCLRYREKDYFYKNLGDAYCSISIYEKAIYNYQKALKLNDHHDEAHYNLAVCLYIQQNYYNAKYSIQKAIEINPLCQQYHQLLNNIQTRMNHC